jgi:hypothetical protein
MLSGVVMIGVRLPESVVIASLAVVAMFLAAEV